MKGSRNAWTVPYTLTSVCVRKGEIRLTRGLTEALRHSKPCLLYNGERVSLKVEEARGVVSGLGVLFEKWGVRANDTLLFFPTPEGLELEVKRRKGAEGGRAKETPPPSSTREAPSSPPKAQPSPKRVVRIFPGGKEEVVLREGGGGRNAPPSSSAPLPFTPNPARMFLGPERAGGEGGAFDPQLEAKGKLTGAILALLDEEEEGGGGLLDAAGVFGDAEGAERVLDLLTAPPLFLLKRVGGAYALQRDVESSIEEAIDYFTHLRELVRKKKAQRGRTGRFSRAVTISPEVRE